MENAKLIYKHKKVEIKPCFVESCVTDEIHLRYKTIGHSELVPLLFMIDVWAVVGPIVLSHRWLDAEGKAKEEVRGNSSSALFVDAIFGFLSSPQNSYHFISVRRVKGNYFFEIQIDVTNKCNQQINYF